MGSPGLPDASILGARRQKPRPFPIGDRDDNSPHRIPGPINLELSFLYRQPVEYLAMLKGIERLDAFTVCYVADDILDLQRFMVFALGYSSTLQ